MKKSIIISILLVLIQSKFCAQDFNIFIQSKRYEVHCKTCVKNYYFFGQFYIDKNKKNIIDLKGLEEGINRVIPNQKSSDLIVLDIENKIYQDIKTKNKSHINYQSNISELVDMIRFTKKMRPNSKVVLYGLPFNFNYEFQKKYNDFYKLRPLLLAVDYLSPSLYLMYSGMEKRDYYFEDYINSNLDLTFQMAEKVNKPVLPFLWYKVHPYNKLSGGSLIDDNLYKIYLNLIKNYRYKNRKVAGIIYWEPGSVTIDINQKLNHTLKILK